MKNYIFTIVFLAFTSSLFGQQLLWSSVEEAETKYVSIENTPNEVLSLYDYYDYYYDFTGFNKDAFMESFGQDSNNWDWVDDITEPIVIAIKIPLEQGLSRGSAVSVMYINKYNLDMIIFTNLLIDTSYNRTSSYDRTKFIKWFENILE